MARGTTFVKKQVRRASLVKKPASNAKGRFASFAKKHQAPLVRDTATKVEKTGASTHLQGAPTRHHIKLTNGVQMPGLGYGTYLMSSRKCKQTVSDAIAIGYRLIDTAAMYGNEAGVGMAIRDCGISRRELFVSSKVYPTSGYGTTLQAFETTMSALQLDYLDLYLIHWPGSDRKKRVDSWGAMIDLYKTGRVRAIGVSNYMREHLEEIMVSEVPPMVNQCELHPKCQYRSLRSWCSRQGIAWMSYMPFGGEGAPLLGNRTVMAIAKKCGSTAAQVMLRWSLDQGGIPLPKSANRDRMAENMLLDFRLPARAISELRALDSDTHYDWNPMLL